MVPALLMVLAWEASMSAREAVANNPRWGGGTGVMSRCVTYGPVTQSLCTSISLTDLSPAWTPQFYLFSGSQVKWTSEPQIAFQEGQPRL